MTQIRWLVLHLSLTQFVATSYLKKPLIARFKLLTAVLLKIQVSLVVMPCRLVSSDVSEGLPDPKYGGIAFL
jgi:hypothetical protein